MMYVPNLWECIVLQLIRIAPMRLLWQSNLHLPVAYLFDSYSEFYFFVLSLPSTLKTNLI